MRADKVHLWMTPMGDLFLVTNVMVFDQALFSDLDCTDGDAYLPICSTYLLEKLGCECLGEV